MSRKSRAVVRPATPDPKFQSELVGKFIGRMMLSGKKSIVTAIVYDAFDAIQKKTGENPIAIFDKAIENVKPVVEVKSRRVGGANYQVPVEIRAQRREALSMRWIISAARDRNGKSMADKLASELIDASQSTGSAYKKKEDVHRMAEANKAFSSFKF